jgi:lipoyl(octanoyl) transferase
MKLQLPLIIRQLIIRQLGQQPYLPVWQAMQEFTLSRGANTPDEIWLLEHPPVYTLGRNGKIEHLLDPGDIPVIHIDRGGQITYHGPGQLIAYVLVDLKRREMGVRELVSGIEHCLVQTLEHFQLNAYAKKQAPGVYIDEAKIAALGLRIKKGCSFHGLSLNIDMDLTPFKRINPCGYRGLKIIQLADLMEHTSLSDANSILVHHFCRFFGIEQVISKDVLPERSQQAKINMTTI